MMIEQPSEYVSKKEYEIKVACYAKNGKSHFRFFFLPAVAHYFFSVGVEVEEIDDETWLFKGSAQRRPHFTREGELSKNADRHVEPFGKSPATATVNSDGSVYIRCPIETRVAL
ncbi:MAG TPA: hypothetical protein VFX22_02520, partial [Candidatus Kapabacteria bacterium]|nr:hypothetical protein [Candidatus Kapabacteria bacterium]